MALVRCVECGKEVSTQAATCPHCGHSIAAAEEEKDKGSAVLKVGTLGCAVFIALFMIGAVLLGTYEEDEGRREQEKANPTCETNWRKCSDNADLINHYGGVIGAQVDCRMEAEKRARFGSPKWPPVPFGSFYEGVQDTKTGMAILIEPDARFENAFGVMVRSTVVCAYNLNRKEVVSVSITPN
jgi:DNA-directed RNA polymerase subunit RPC12/RpoP